ncbi:SDR family NAD(P)-dependent oxidoreductase [Rudaeicoccus suwonensis]|uniref:Short subunit dehydrogenase n=1 Tax=Rudaeicoccus suwonensis TaxID=657409 RepID=A0A561E7R4_9MICO|nr:SDR family NAD(P)-dependent oxidoreductase [Rudaeicoccus suwonensis]TWE11649.1 short subunit dehydrogenase [Rudaeicoccus suwonensis]
MSADLTGSVVVVAGAAGDLGRPTAAACAAAGATVIAAGRSEDRLDEVVALDPQRIVAAEVDLLDETATVAWGRSVLAEHGRVDGLLHLVGGWRGGQPIVESDSADWAFLHGNIIRTLQNTTRAFRDALEVGPHGRMAIVSTTGLAKPKQTNAAYLTAKAGAEMWLQCVAESFRDTNAAASIVRVMALVTPQMQAAKPEGYKSYSPVGQVADWMVDLFGRPVAEVNGLTESMKR